MFVTRVDARDAVNSRSGHALVFAVFAVHRGRLLPVFACSRCACASERRFESWVLPCVLGLEVFDG